MYKIYADNHLIYDSTIEDYKISKGSITLETNKSGSFTFSLYPDHFYYDKFVRLKTIITVYKSGKIVFRGRILNDVTDYWNNKVITCEGELGFLQDSIIRPFEFSGTPADLFKKFIEEHNSQVDDFKKFNIGEVTVIDTNDYIARSNSNYESALSNLNSRLIGETLGGYFYITHGADGTDPTPTINYLADFTNVSSQKIEFGTNLKKYTKTVNADSIATAIIPLGAEIDDGNSDTENKKLNIASINNGIDYVFEPSAVAMYGWIFAVVEWDDVTTAEALKKKAEDYLQESINQNITIELNAIDLHLLDSSIESFKIGDYIQVASEPHNFDATLLCNKQTINLLKPDNDSVTLGYTKSSFTEITTRSTSSVSTSLGSTKDDMLAKISSQDLARQRLGALLSQSLGVFTTEEKLENGSTVYYMHDNQVLEDSKTIWKLTADAFAVSTDGGKTWNAGLDSSGNAVLNVLSAIGVKAEWIDADTLESISASIGGWAIDSTGLYKEVTSVSDSNTIHRVYLKAPISNSSEVLSCKKSIDGGSTFETTFRLQADGTVRFGNTYIHTDGYMSIELPDDNKIVFQEDGLHFTGLSSSSIRGLVLANDELRLQVDNINYDTIFDSEGYTGSIVVGGKTLNFYKGILDTVK